MQGRESVWYAACGAALALGGALLWAVTLSRFGLLPPLTELSLLQPVGIVAAGLSAGVFGTFGALLGRRIHALRRQNALLAERAVTDPLTQLRNRAFFEEQLATETSRGDRDGRPFALISLDLDRFKDVNDRFGHAAGDASLIHAAQVILANKRLADVACRVGGEEFLIICPGAALDEGRRVAERIRDALEHTPAAYAGATIQMTASFGVAARFPGMPAVHVTDAADRALYAAKARGRNNVCALGPSAAATTWVDAAR